MMETQATVVAVEPGFAWIESERSSGCSHCSSRAGCGVSTLGRLFGARRNRMRLADPLGVQAGDSVVIGLSEQRLLGAAALAYMAPLLVMIAVAVLSAQLGYSPLTTIPASLLGLIGGLWLANRRTRLAGDDGRYSPVLLRRTVSAEIPVNFEHRKRSQP